MLQWFNELEKSGKYNFHIQAWWRNELEVYIRNFCAHLLNYLPARVINSLSLQEELQYSSSEKFHTLTAQCRSYVNSQIQKFARGKYIPDLYVDRSLQIFLNEFLESEDYIAHNTKKLMIDLLKNVILDIDEYLIEHKKRTGYFNVSLRNMKNNLISLNNKKKRVSNRRYNDKDKELEEIEKCEKSINSTEMQIEIRRNAEDISKEWLDEVLKKSKYQ
jgi:hypothetical protein